MSDAQNPVHELLAMLADRRDTAQRAATQKGDTEFDKGRYHAYRDVADLIPELLKGDDTQEPSQEK